MDTDGAAKSQHLPHDLEEALSTIEQTNLIPCIYDQKEEFLAFIAKIYPCCFLVNHRPREKYICHCSV